MLDLIAGRLVAVAELTLDGGLRELDQRTHVRGARTVDLDEMRRMFGDDDCLVHRLERARWEARRAAAE